MSRSKLCSYCGFALLFESLSIKFVFLYLFHIFIFIYFIFLLSFTIICCHGSYSFFFFKRFCTSSQQAEYIFSTSSGFFFSQLLAIAQNFSGADSIVFEDILLSVLFCVICFVLCTSLLRNKLFQKRVFCFIFLELF